MKIPMILKNVLNALPRAISLSVKSFLVVPPAVIFLVLLFSSNFDLHIAGMTLAQTTKADLGHLWNIIGWLSFFALVAFAFVKRYFTSEKKGYYFQIPIAQHEDAALDENSKVIAHGIKFNDDTYLYFSDNITKSEAERLLRVFSHISKQSGMQY